MSSWRWECKLHEGTEGGKAGASELVKDLESAKKFKCTPIGNGEPRGIMCPMTLILCM